MSDPTKIKDLQGPATSLALNLTENEVFSSHLVKLRKLDT